MNIMIAWSILSIQITSKANVLVDHVPMMINMTGKKDKTQKVPTFSSIKIPHKIS